MRQGSTLNFPDMATGSTSALPQLSSSFPSRSFDYSLSNAQPPSSISNFTSIFSSSDPLAIHNSYTPIHEPGFGVAPPDQGPNGEEMEFSFNDPSSHDSPLADPFSSFYQAQPDWLSPLDSPRHSPIDTVAMGALLPSSSLFSDSNTSSLIGDDLAQSAYAGSNYSAEDSACLSPSLFSLFSSSPSPSPSLYQRPQESEAAGLGSTASWEEVSTKYPRILFGALTSSSLRCLL